LRFCWQSPFPAPWGTDALWFAGPYVALRVLGLLVYDLARHAIPLSERPSASLRSRRPPVSSPSWPARAAGGQAVYWLWGLAVVLDLVAAGVGGQLEHFNRATVDYECAPERSKRVVDTLKVFDDWWPHRDLAKMCESICRHQADSFRDALLTTEGDVAPAVGALVSRAADSALRKVIRSVFRRCAWVKNNACAALS
jgi:hypothetical protein